MTKQKILFLLGVWVAILSFLGFPNVIKTILFILTGLFLIFISYSISKKMVEDTTKEIEQESEPMRSFIDNVEKN